MFATEFRLTRGQTRHQQSEALLCLCSFSLFPGLCVKKAGRSQCSRSECISIEASPSCVCGYLCVARLAQQPKSAPDEVGLHPRSRFHACARLTQAPSRCEADVGVLGGGFIVARCCSILAVKALYELLSGTGRTSSSNTKTRGRAVGAGLPFRWCTAVRVEHQFAALRSSRPFSPHNSDGFPRVGCAPLIC